MRQGIEHIISGEGCEALRSAGVKVSCATSATLSSVYLDYYK